MNQEIYIPNVDEIARRAKARFLSELPRMSFLQSIKDSVPYWIFLVAFPLFAISAPHTAYVWNQITPGVGFVAPVFVEFGLLYGSFRRRYARMKHETNPFFFSVLSVLLFVVAILSNGAGAITEVAKATQNANLSVAELWAQFGNLPITSQASLIMAVLSAFIVPIGAWASGESIGHLIFEYEHENENFREAKWRDAARDKIGQALYTEYRGHGYNEADAQRHARRDLQGYMNFVSTPLSSVHNTVSTVSNRVDRGVQSVDSTAQKVLPLPNKAEQARMWLLAHPEYLDKSINTAHSAINAEGMSLSRTLFANVLRKVKQDAPSKSSVDNEE